jgi:hypothetical protein
MYSPKIKEEYIPILYRKARELKIPMTELVNRIIAGALGEAQKAADALKEDANKYDSQPP